MAQLTGLNHAEPLNDVTGLDIQDNTFTNFTQTAIRVSGDSSGEIDHNVILGTNNVGIQVVSAADGAKRRPRNGLTSAIEPGV